MDLIGQKFGRLTVIKKGPKKQGGKQYWMCKCECGNTKSVYQYNLISGQTQSCGCLQKEIAKSNLTKHGFSKTPIYKIWEAMKRRCDSPKSQRYASYGGRGITYCADWKTFEGFYQWASTSGYKPGMSIERVDVDKNYCPENCKWIPLKDQPKNKTTSDRYTYRGETKCLTDWCNDLNISYSTVYQRIHKLHQPFEKAICFNDRR